MTELKKKRIGAILIALVFAAMLVAGLLTYDDYGITTDEPIQRQHGIVNYQYVLKTLFGHELNVKRDCLSEYQYRYYGVALQMPMILIEHLSNFKMSMHDVFTIRHLYTFLLCYLGYICFYFFCRQIFGKRWLAMLGVLMLALYPRFWGEQFTNIKDMLFLATICATLLCTSLCLSYEGKWRYEVFAAIAGAISFNVRIAGFIVPALLFGYRILRDVWLVRVPNTQGMGQLWRNIGRYVSQLLMMLVFIIIITPASWEAPFAFFQELMTTFSNYQEWQGDVSFLWQRIPGNQLPWYYIPVWLGLSLPLWYLVLLLVSLPLVIVRVACRRSDWARALLLEKERYYVMCFVVAILPVIVMLLKEVTLYNAWRHVYYFTPALVVMMLFGFGGLWELAQNKKAVRCLLAGATCTLLLYQTCWIIREHPLEKVYFNPIGRTMAEGMERDYWKESIYHQIQYILARDPSEQMEINYTWFIDQAYSYYLTDADRARIVCDIADQEQNTEYIIIATDEFFEKRFDGYTLINEIRVDGIAVSWLFIRNDVLADRFGGVYPQ